MAGISAGVINVVPGHDAAQIVSAWLEDIRVRKLSFTGSTGIGRILLRQAADRVVNTSMELGGNAPFIVTVSADVERAIDGAMVASSATQAKPAPPRIGSTCMGASHRIHRAFGVQVEELDVGPADTGATTGPLISKRAVDRVSHLVQQAIHNGAEIAAQAPPASAPGYFFRPVVMANVSPDSSLVKEEIFGPVAPVLTWSDETDLIAMVNDTEFGLASYVHGELGDAVKITEQMDAGMVGVNRGLISDPSAPLGGVKQSGTGREGARGGIDEYLETKFVSIDC